MFFGDLNTSIIVKTFPSVSPFLLADGLIQHNQPTPSPIALHWHMPRPDLAAGIRRGESAQKIERSKTDFEKQTRESGGGCTLEIRGGNSGENV